VIDTLLAIAAAMLVAYMRGSLTDRMVMIGCTVGQSIMHPRLHHRLPSTCLRTSSAGFPSRVGRRACRESAQVQPAADIVGVIVSLAPIRASTAALSTRSNQDYVRTARAKGMSETRVMWVPCCAMLDPRSSPT